MAIAEDASTPAVATGTGTGPLTTASFSPPSGALLVALVAAELGGVTAPSIGVTDSAGLIWHTKETDSWSSASRGGRVQVYYTYLTSAPGSMTVSAGFTNLTGGRFLGVRVLTGASQYQGGATAWNLSASALTSTNLSITTTHAGSAVYGISLDFTSAATFTANGTTTLLGSHVNTTDGATAAAWRTTSAVASPSTVTPGGTWGSANTSITVAVEVLAAGTYSTAGLTNGGATAHYQFAYDSALSPSIEPARTNAVLAEIENDYALIQSWFGVFPAITSLTVLVQTGGTGFSWGVGATQTGTVITTNNEGYSYSSSPEALRSGLLHEVAEIHMWAFDEAHSDTGTGGWFFNTTHEGSAGEGLARFLAGIFLERLGLANSLGMLEDGDFGVSNLWLNSVRTNFLSANTSDISPGASTGCTALFVYYLHKQLGYTIPQIVNAGIGAIALQDVAKTLTGNPADPFPAFKALLDTAFPSTTLSQIGGANPDNPFPLPHGAGTSTIVEDSSSPAVVSGTGTGTLTTASFSPPAGSLLVALVSGERGTAATTATVTSTSGTWTNRATATGTTARFGVARVATCYFATAPGAITVSAAFTNLSGGRLLAVKVLTGSAVDLATAAVVQVAGTVSDDRSGAASITTGKTKSVVYGISNNPTTAATLTVNGATSLIGSHVNATNGASAAAWRATTATSAVGSTKLGVSWSAANPANVAAVEILAAPATAELVDNFNDNSVNATLWPNSYGTRAETGGVASVSALTTLSGYGSAAVYTLAGSQISVKVTPPTSTSGTPTTTFGALTYYATAGTGDYTNYLRFFADTTAGLLRWRWVVGSSTVWGFSRSYSPTNHAWLRIREAAGTVFFDASPDGLTWTTIDADNATPALVTSATKGEIDLEARTDAGTATAASFDDFNVVPVNAGATLSGTGSFSSVASAPIKPAVSTFAGAGALTANPTLVQLAQASLTGSGALSATVTPGGAAASALAGTGALTADLTLARAVATSLTGAGQLTSAMVQDHATQLALTGSGALTGSMARQVDAEATLAAVGEFEAGTDPSVAASTTLTGAGSLAAAAQDTTLPTATLAAAGTLTANPRATVLSQAALVGTGELSSDALLTRPAGALLSGTGALAAASTRIVSASVTLTGSGALGAAPQGLVGVAATMAAAGFFNSEPVTPTILTGVGALQTTAVRMVQAFTPLSATGRLLHLDRHEVQRWLAGVGTVTAGGIQVHPTAMLFRGRGEMDVSAQRVRLASAALTGAGRLVSPAQVRSTPLALAAVGAAVAGAQTARGALARLAGAGSLGASPRLAYAVQAVLRARGALAARVLRQVTPAATLAGSGRLTGDLAKPRATLAAVGALTAAMQRRVLARAALRGNSALGASPQITPIVAARTRLRGSGSLSATALSRLDVQAALGGIGALIAHAHRGRLAQAQLAGAGSLSAAAHQLRSAQAQLGAHGALIAQARALAPLPSIPFPDDDQRFTVAPAVVQGQFRVTHA